MSSAKHTAAGRLVSAMSGLVDQLAPGQVLGQVRSIQSGSVNAVSVTQGADTAVTAGIRYDDGYSPTVGDWVVMDTLPNNQLYVRGKRA